MSKCTAHLSKSVRTKARDEWVQCSVYAMVVLRYQAQKEFAVDPKM